MQSIGRGGRDVEASLSCRCVCSGHQGDKFRCRGEGLRRQRAREAQGCSIAAAEPLRKLAEPHLSVSAIMTSGRLVVALRVSLLGGMVYAVPPYMFYSARATCSSAVRSPRSWTSETG